MAIKLDPTWCRVFDIGADEHHSEVEKARYKRLGQIVSGDLWWVENVWFVEYNIHRIPGVERLRTRWECRTASGTFVEIKCGDPGWDFFDSVGFVVSHFEEELPYHLQQLDIEFDHTLGINTDDEF
jgi:hypothetical protein